MIYTAVGKDTHVIENKPDPEVESEAVRRLAEALDPSVIDALLADAKTAGTRLPSPGHSRGAATPQAEVIGVAHSVLSLAEAVLPVANRSVVTDVAAANEAARAAAATARLNLEANLRGIRDDEVRARLAGVLDLVEPLAARAAAVESAVREMVG